MSGDESGVVDPLVMRPPVQVASRVAMALLVVGLLLSYSCFFAVRVRTAAIVTRFGRPVRVVQEAGPSWRWPWPIEEVHRVDLRTRVAETPYTATLTRDKKTVLLLTYAIWRVVEPLRYVQAAGGEVAAERKIAGLVTAAKNVQMGRFDLGNLVSTRPEDLRVEEIEKAILAAVAGPAREKLGVEILQVGFQRIAYPEENTPAVLEYMRSERRAVADRLRAEGQRDAARLLDAALVETEEIVAEGRVDAGRIRGEAEREVARIQAEAHRLDPDFYRLWRSLDAVENTLRDQATVVLRSDTGFFRVLSEPAGPPSSGPRGEQ